MNSYDVPKNIKNYVVYCARQVEKPILCKLIEIKRYSFASLASLSIFRKDFFDKVNMEDSFEAVLKDKDGNIKEMRKQ